jgi:hypothetical protein
MTLTAPPIIEAIKSLGVVVGTFAKTQEKYSDKKSTVKFMRK